MKIYIKYWFTCTLATHAALNDMHLIAELRKYRNINKPIANAGLEVFSRHLWYLSEIAVGLSFFDPRHDEETLKEMSAALKNSGDERCLFRNKTLNVENDFSIAGLISNNTNKFFEIAEISCKLFEKDPSFWKQNEDFLKTQQIMNNLTVVNDPAERAIGLIKNVNNTLTKDLSEQNNIIQVVENYNKTHKNNHKRTILDNFKERKD